MFSFERNILLYIYTFLLFLLFLDSMYIYYLWNVNNIFLGIVTLILSIMLILGRHVELEVNSKCLWFAVLLFTSLMFGSYENGFTYYFRMIIKALNIAVLLSFASEEKQFVLNFITKGFALILGVSLTVFLLLYIFELPDNGMLSYDDDRYLFVNYFVYIKNINDIAIPRFNAVFLEPGHVGMIIAFLLYANRFNFKSNYIKILFISLIFTWSLAGYVLTAIGFFLYLLMGTNSLVTRLSRIVVYLALIASVVYVNSVDNDEGVSFVSEDNILGQLIINRLELDEEKFIAGNNRTTQVVDDDFEKAVDDGTIIMGIGGDEFVKRKETEVGFTGSGYKMYILQRGIIGTILMLLTYIIVVRTHVNRKYMTGMLILYMASFLQRAYPIWEAWLIPFICCSDFVANEEDEEDDEDYVLPEQTQTDGLTS